MYKEEFLPQNNLDFRDDLSGFSKLLQLLQKNICKKEPVFWFSVNDFIINQTI